MSRRRIGLIGAGNMGGALVRGILEAGLVNEREVRISDPEKEKVVKLKRELGIECSPSNFDLASWAEVVILAVKPGVVGHVLEEIREVITEKKLVISVAAGVPTKYIEGIIGRKAAVIRVMPNTPALIRKGASAFSPGRFSDSTAEEEVSKIFSAVGTAVKVTEEVMDIVTAVSGSGPAYIFLMAEVLAENATSMGLKKEIALGLVNQMILGAAYMLKSTSESAASLRQKVTSPGGTTEAALAVFERENFRELISQALGAAAKRCRELAIK